jgi:hypothetical protein
VGSERGWLRSKRNHERRSLAADENLAVRVAAGQRGGSLGWPCLSQCMAGYGPAVPNSRANPLGMVNQPPSKVSGLLYGLGLGGFIDGIVLHQILQWHQWSAT